MTHKQIVTNREMEKDIITAIKYPAEMTERHYGFWTIVTTIAGCLGIVLEFLYIYAILWVLLGLFLVLVGDEILRRIRVKRKTARVSIADYEIALWNLDSKSDENFVVHTGGKYHRRAKHIKNYTLHFENGQSWRIPERIYLWNDRYSMQRSTVYETANNGEAFIVVIRKEGGEIAVAYPTEIFEYKN